MFDFVKQGIESLYSSKADIWTFKTDESEPVFVEDSLRPALAYENKPCRVSQKNIGASAGGVVRYETRLFISPDLDIPAGSRITVTDQHGNVSKYVGSGEAFKYSNHQEITLLKDDVS